VPRLEQSKYGTAAPSSPRNEGERLDLCGGFDPAMMEAYWDANAGQHATFFLAGQTDPPPDSVRLWKIWEKVGQGGPVPDLSPQPTGNCVAAATDDVVELLQLCEIHDGESEVYKPIYNPYHYATGRVLIGKNKLRGRAGSIGGWQAQAIEKYGVVHLRDGLPKYTKKNVDSWGDDKKAESQSFRDYMEEGAEHICGATSRLDSMGHLFEALGNKYPVTIASNRGYTMKVGADGFHRASGNWSHQMSIWGYGKKGSKTWAAIKNQWGNVHGVVLDPETGEPWPPGFICVHLDEFEAKHFRGSEAISYSRFKGYPQQDYDHSQWA
jgi:hypothetical protein